MSSRMPLCRLGPEVTAEHCSAWPPPVSERVLQHVPSSGGRGVGADTSRVPQAHAAGLSLSRAVVKPETLQKATVELLDQGLCASLYGHSLTDRMVCAGYLDGKVDSCQVSLRPAPAPPAPGPVHCPDTPCRTLSTAADCLRFSSWPWSRLSCQTGRRWGRSLQVARKPQTNGARRERWGRRRGAEKGKDSRTGARARSRPLGKCSGGPVQLSVATHLVA